MNFDQSRAGRWMHRLATRPGWGWATHLRDPMNFGLDRMASDLGLEVPVPSQLRQDLFVLAVTMAKKEGFFVEFGATNGHDLSNTYLLEKEFGWSGVVSEPSPVWHDELANNRSCKIDKRCVWTNSGENARFTVSDVGELSTLSAFSELELHQAETSESHEIDVETVSLNDLLRSHDAPHRIDYLSIDTEGSELPILNAFDFSAYQIDIITCEHNYTEDRAKIRSLLADNGYRPVWPIVSRFDDWFVHSRLTAR